MTSSGCSLLQFLARVISNYIYLKGSLKYFFTASKHGVIVSCEMSLHLISEHRISQNHKCSSAVKLIPVLLVHFYAMDYNYIQQPWGGPKADEEETEAASQIHPILDNLGLISES